MMLGIAPEAQTAATVLGHNFPDSDWYKDAYNLVRNNGFEPSENKGSSIKAFKGVAEPRAPAARRPVSCASLSVATPRR